MKIDITAELLLKVMCSIQHSDDYYKQAAKSHGLDVEELTHFEISVLNAEMRRVEAMAIIKSAEDGTSAIGQLYQEALESVGKKLDQAKSASYL